MNHGLQVSNLSNLQSFNQDGLKVAFQSGQFLQTQIPIKLNKNAFIGIGLAQMIIGVICFIFNIALLFTWSGFSVVGYGIWGGIFFFISGLLACLTGKKSTSKRLIVSTMVMNVFSACASVPVFILGIMDAVGYVCDGPYCMYEIAQVGIGSTIAALAIIEAIISITCSAFCCNAYCCCSAVDNVVVIYEGSANSNPIDPGYEQLAFPPPLSHQLPFPQNPVIPQQPLSSQNNGFQMNNQPHYIPMRNGL